MPKVKFKARTTAEIEDLDIENGSLIYDTQTGKTYLDYNGNRIPTGSGSSGSGIPVSDTPPTYPLENDLWVDTTTDSLKRYNGTNWEAVGGTITGDTLPIGSIVEFDGSTIPAGWEEVSGTNKIKKVSQVAGLVGGVSNTYSESTTDVYSCNYENSIIESGSNENGNWIKYIDGTMICTKEVTQTVSITTSWGSMYESGEISLGNFPQTFIATPIVNLSVRQDDSRAGFIELIKGITTQSAGKTLLARATSASSTSYTFYIIAIGKWK